MLEHVGTVYEYFQILSNYLRKKIYGQKYSVGIKLVRTVTCAVGGKVTGLKTSPVITLKILSRLKSDFFRNTSRVPNNTFWAYFQKCSLGARVRNRARIFLNGNDYFFNKSKDSNNYFVNTAWKTATKIVWKTYVFSRFFIKLKTYDSGKMNSCDYCFTRKQIIGLDNHKIVRTQ